MFDISSSFNRRATENRFGGNRFKLSSKRKDLLGTTALLRMLAQHRDLHPSKESSRTYEELQFFSNDTLYLNGINWSVEE